MTVFLAQAFSLYLIVTGISLLLNSKKSSAVYKEFFASRGMLTLAGVLALVIGILLILSHNIWVIGWPVIITILSWWVFIKGTLLLLIPDRIIAYSKDLTKEPALKIAAIFMIALGLLLGYFGFFASMEPLAFS